MQNNVKYDSIDDYIASHPEETQKILNSLRDVIRQCAPEAGEKISYQMPTFTLHGNLVHFAAYKNHIGFYPGSKAVATFGRELSPYKIGKGTIQFPISQPLPFDLIRDIVAFRVAENIRIASEKKKNK